VVAVAVPPVLVGVFPCVVLAVGVLPVVVGDEGNREHAVIRNKRQQIDSMTKK
jgi:hypothetical protein